MHRVIHKSHCRLGHIWRVRTAFFISITSFFCQHALALRITFVLGKNNDILARHAVYEYPMGKF